MPCLYNKQNLNLENLKKFESTTDLVWHNYTLLLLVMIEQGSADEGHNQEDDDEDGYIDDDFPDYYPGEQEGESNYMEPVNVQQPDEGKSAFICIGFNTIPQ